MSQREVHKEKKKKVEINYNEEVETDVFDYFEDDDPFKEIIIS